MSQRYILIVLIALSGNAFAQTNASSQLWLDYNHKVFIKPDLSIYGDIGFRTDISNNDWYVAYIRPRIAFRANKTFAFGGGVAYYYNWNTPSVDNSEFRIEQQVTAAWPSFKKFSFDNRLRIDERYFNYAESAEMKVPDKWSARLRYRLMVKTDYFNLSEKFGDIYVLLASETFVPLESSQSGSRIIKERIVLGFGQLLPNGRRYQVDFMWQGPLNTNAGDSRSVLWMLRLRYYVEKNKFK